MLRREDNAVDSRRDVPIDDANLLDRIPLAQRTIPHDLDFWAAGIANIGSCPQCSPVNRLPKLVRQALGNDRDAIIGDAQGWQPANRKMDHRETPTRHILAPYHFKTGGKNSAIRS